MERATEAAALGLRFFVATVLIAAAVPKLARPAEFELAVANYRLLPTRLNAVVARSLPWLELLAGIFLLLGFIETPVAFASAALLLLFAFAVAANLLRGREIECGCSGLTAPRRIGWHLVVRDLVLAAVALTVGVAGRPVLAIDALWHSGGTFHPSEAVAFLIAGTIAALVEAILAAGLRTVTASRHVSRHLSGGRL